MVALGEPSGTCIDAREKISGNRQGSWSGSRRRSLRTVAGIALRRDPCGIKIGRTRSCCRSFMFMDQSATAGRGAQGRAVGDGGPRARVGADDGVGEAKDLGVVLTAGWADAGRLPGVDAITSGGI